MNSIELFLLDIGLSWTISKLLPYLIAIAIGLILINLLKKHIRDSKTIVKWFLRVTLFFFPFGGYFIYSPIYEGDFSNNYVSVKKEAKYNELTGKKFVVISMPGCSYCFESIDRMKKLLDRIPQAEIEYIVCLSSDSLSTEWYQNKAGDNIIVRLAKDSDALTQLAEGTFPTFVLVNNESPLTKWSNDSFGVLAMDNVEEFLKK